MILFIFRIEIGCGIITKIHIEREAYTSVKILMPIYPGGIEVNHLDCKLETIMRNIENGKLKTACVLELVDTYYQSVIWKSDEMDNKTFDCDREPFPVEFSVPVEERDSGIGVALMQLIDKGQDVDVSEGGFNALMLAVGEGDALMVRFLIQHGADADSWPEMDEDPSASNFYLDDIDIHYMNESFANDKDQEYMEALHRTALVLAEDAHLGPYVGHCLTIDKAGTVTLRPARVLF